MSDEAKAKKIKSKVLKTMELVENGKGRNYKKWNDFFKNKSPKEVISFFKKMIKDGNNFYFEIEPYVNEPTLDNLERALENLGLTPEEHIYFRDKDDALDPRSLCPVPVLPLHIKRLQQVISKKNNYTYSASSRNAVTNQVSGEDEVARNSDVESYALKVYNAEKISQELMGPRADGTSNKVAMYRNINEKGYVRLDELPQDQTNRSTVAMMDAYLLGAGMKTDLLTDSNVLLQSLKDIENE